MDQREVMTRELENGLTLQVVDESRQIAADRWLVRLRFKVGVSVAEHFEDLPDNAGAGLSELLETLGSVAVFEVVKERNFVSIDARQAVCDDLLNAFLRHTAPYLGRPAFPGKFLLKALKDHRSRPPLPND